MNTSTLPVGQLPVGAIFRQFGGWIQFEVFRVGSTEVYAFNPHSKTFESFPLNTPVLVESILPVEQEPSL